AFRHRGRHFRDGPHLVGEVRGQLVYIVGEVFPGPGGAGDRSLTTQLALDADFSGHRGDLRREGCQRVGHLVDGVRQRRDLALGLEDNLAAKVAVRNRGYDPGDTADLVGQVARHQVHALREVFPGSGHTLHLSLATQVSLRTDLASHPGDFRGEGVQLVDHDVDRVLQFEDFAFDLDGDLLGEVALLNRACHPGYVAHVRREIAGHEIDVVGKVFPDSDHALDLGLATQLAFGTDFAGDARDF